MSIRPWHATLLFGLLTVALTWPQAVRPFSIPDHIDSYFSVWRLSWIAHQLRTDPRHLFDANIFYPARTTLAYSDATLFEGVVAAPFIWIGVPAVAVYNAEVLLTFVACGLGMWLLARRLTGSPAAAIIAGLIFAFVPFRFDHYMHLELLNMQWMPLTLWSLIRTLESRRVRDGLATGCFMALLTLSTIYYAVLFTVAMTPVVLIMVAHARRSGRLWASLGIALVLSAATVALYAKPYRTAQAAVGTRSAGDVMLYSAGPIHYLAAMPNSLLYGGLTSSIGRHEKRLFPGLVAIVLVICALWRPLDVRRVACLLGLCVAVDLSFGHRGLSSSFLITHLDIFRGLRAYARSGAVVMLFVAALAAYGLARVRAHHLARFPPPLPDVAVAAIAGVMLLEYIGGPPPLVDIDTQPPPVYRWLAEQPSGVLLELPLSFPTDTRIPDERHYLYASTFHFRPMINGYSGFGPVQVQLLSALRQFPADTALTALIANQVRYVLVHSRFMSQDAYTGLRAQAAVRPELADLGTFPDEGFSVEVYRVGGP